MTRNSLFDKKLLEDEFHPRIKAYYFKEWKEYNMAPHTHDRVEIMYVISGKCLVEAMGNPLHMKKGDFVLLDANVAHSLVVEKHSPCRMLNIEFGFHAKSCSFPALKEWSANGSITGLFHLEKPYILLKDPDELYPVLKGLIMELDEKKVDNEFMVQTFMAQILIKISRMVRESELTESSQSAVYVKKALRYLHSHYYEDIRVKEIASIINVHENYLHRIFKSGMGCTIIEYLTNIRLEKSRMLLAHTDIPITEISGYIGINSRQYFTFIFKKSTGMTPAQYRKSTVIDSRVLKKG